MEFKSTTAIWLLALASLFVLDASAVDRESKSDYVEELPNEDGIYYRNGIAFTKDELNRDIELQYQGQLQPRGSSSLVVNINSDGQLDYWRDLEQRRLTYAIDRRSFSGDEYDLVTEVLAIAGESWEGICSECGVRFVHKQELDEYPNPFDTTFIVKRTKISGVEVASFLPSSPVGQRILQVGSPFFEMEPGFQVGVLRHSLGHTLGYRHNSTGVEGCFTEIDVPPLIGRYDPQSVMHLPCGSGEGNQFEFSYLDIQSHKELYGLGTLVVYVEEFETVLNSLKSLAVVEGLMSSYPYERGEQTLCQQFGDSIGLQRKMSNRECRSAHSVAQQLGKIEDSPSGLSIPNVSLIVEKQYQEFAPGPRGEARLKKLLARQDVTDRKRDVNGFITVYWPTYRLEVSLSKRSESLVYEAERRLGRVKGNISYDVRLTDHRIGPPPAPKLFSSLSPEKYSQKCESGTAEDEEFGAYSMLLGVPESDLPACATSACAQNSCPRIILIDSPVQVHPDIRDSISGGVPTGTELTQSQTCSVLPNSSFADVHHGTHLAGIMVSRNRFHGISQLASLTAYERGVSNRELQSIINRERLSGQEGKIFVFASRFAYEPRDYPRLVVETVGNNPPTEHALDRATRRPRLAVTAFLPPADAIVRGQRTPWVVAIGQVDPGQTPISIGKSSAFSPANLAPEDNVIVVTACTDCTKPSAGIWKQANVGDDEEYVPHVAAPGGIDEKGIPATATATLYAKGYGTSQATAFVGGLAAAMVGCHSGYYQNFALRTKQRLQLTAKPIIGDDFAKVKSGVVDPVKALLDPTRAHVSGGLGINGELENAKVKWCKDRLRFSFGGRPKSIDTANIYRIAKVSHLEADAWLVYTLEDADSASVTKWGPYDRVDTNDPIISLDGSPHSLDDIGDLLLPLAPRDQIVCPA